jgi:nucleotide-binding universal stress UspA family protein
MTAPFKNIALAVSFSPTSMNLLTEAKRLQKLFDARLSVIHIGTDSSEIRDKLKQLLNDAGLEIDEVNLIISRGNPSEIIIKTCVDNSIDLLILGALQEEKFLNYYLGSVARTLMREAPCSVLFLSASKEKNGNFSKFCVSSDFSKSGEITLKLAYKWALLEKLDEITIIREIQAPGLAMTVNDGGSIEETAEIRKKWEIEEITKLNLFVRELNLTEIDYKYVCLYGKPGWEAKNYVNKSEADLFIVSAPERKLTFFDKIFPSGIEFIAKQMPCSLLIVKPEFKNCK